MEINLLFLFTVVPAIILFGIAKSGLGGSVSLISIPLMTFMMPLNQALAILLPILIFSAFILVFIFRKLQSTKVRFIAGSETGNAR